MNSYIIFRKIGQPICFNILFALTLLCTSLFIQLTPVNAASLTSVTIVPWNSDISTTGKYTINFTTVSSTPNNAKIIITFPDGFGVSGVTFDSWSGIDGGRSVSIAGQVITITRDATGTASAAGAKYIVLDNITNNSTSASTYTGSVETKTSVDVNIDGPTTSATFSITTTDDGLDTSAPNPKYQIDMRSSGNTALLGPEYSTLEWSVPTASGANVSYSGILVDGDGNLYFGTDSAYMSYTSSGVLRWSVATSAPSFAALSQNGSIYFMTGTHYVTALDKNTGTQLWSNLCTNLTTSSKGAVNIGVDGSVYATGRNNSCIYNSDGSLKYTSVNINNRSGGDSIDPNTGIIYSVHDSRKFSSSYPDGRLRAMIGAATQGTLRAPSVAADGSAYSPALGGALGFYGMNSDGTLKFATSDNLKNYTSGNLSRNDSLYYLIANYPAIGDFKLRAYSTTDGSVQMTSTDTYSNNAGTDNMLYAGNNMIYYSPGFGIDATDGSKKWQNSSFSSGQNVAIGANKHLYFSSYRGGVASITSMKDWTLTSSSPTYTRAGSTIEITATSSMLKNDPATTDNNIVQAVMPNGDKVILTYASTDGTNTTWTGTYTVPADSLPGLKSASVQAAAYKITTDITTTFDSLPTNFTNTGITSSFNYTVDNTAPSSFSTSSPSSNTFTNITAPTFSWDASSDATSGLSKYQIYMDGTLLADNIISSATTYTPSTALSEGTHSWYVVATDVAGNTTTSSTSTLNIDTTAPNGTIKLDSTGTLSLNTATLNISASDPASSGVSSGVGYMRLGESIEAINQASWENYSTSKTWTFANSSRIVYIQFKDLAGNISAITSSNGETTTLTLLKLGTINFNEKYGHYYYTGHRPTFTGIASANSKVVVTIQSDPITCTTTADGNGNWSCTPTTDIPNGDHTVTIQSVGTDGQYTLASFKLGINIGLAATGDDVKRVELVFALLLTFTGLTLVLLTNHSLLKNIIFGKAK